MFLWQRNRTDLQSSDRETACKDSQAINSPWLKLLNSDCFSIQISEREELLTLILFQEKRLFCFPNTTKDSKFYLFQRFVWIKEGYNSWENENNISPCCLCISLLCCKFFPLLLNWLWAKGVRRDANIVLRPLYAKVWIMSGMTGLFACLQASSASYLCRVACSGSTQLLLKAAGLPEVLHCTFSLTPILNTQMFQTALGIFLSSRYLNQACCCCQCF